MQTVTKFICTASAKPGKTLHRLARFGGKKYLNGNMAEQAFPHTKQWPLFVVLGK